MVSCRSDSRESISSREEQSISKQKVQSISDKNTSTQTRLWDTPNHYRPQRSCGQGNIFAPVCHSIHRGVVSHKALRQTPPLPSRHPPEQTPLQSRHPAPRPDTPPPPRSRHSPRADTAPGPDTPPPPPGQTHPREPDSGIWSTSGRYASYWNAFLLKYKNYLDDQIIIYHVLGTVSVLN